MKATTRLKRPGAIAMPAINIIALSFFALLTLTIALATPSRAGTGTCGQPVSAGDSPASSDARFILLGAVGARVVDACTSDVDGSGETTATDALITLGAAVGLPTEFACPACDTDDQCPGVAQFALFSKIRGACSSDADCGGIAVCDQSIGRCRSATDLDVGWTGLAHQADLNDIVPARLIVDCQGPAPCGECSVEALDPQLGNCRCANDNRTTCFAPHEADPTCGGDTCECYFGPPVPLSSGNSPTCTLNRLETDPTGTVNVDEGSGLIEIPLRSMVHLGITNTQPCPYCSDDPIPADGQRGGVCVGGLNDGQSCDAQSENTTFPAEGGARNSLDCFPDPGLNISGSGLQVDLPLSTGTTELDADVPCGPFDTQNCHCRVCSGDGSLACSDDADCAAAGAGTCSSDGQSTNTLANACSDSVCTDLGNGVGQCANGPDDRYCDGVTRADGRGLISCLIDDDCAVGTIGIDAGACSLVERRACFLDPIVANGLANPVAPIASTATCAPPTSNSGINAVAGLPGPVRWTQQSLVTLFCENSPLSVYTPGSGGCPE